jgi:hypothetical protein
MENPMPTGPKGPEMKVYRVWSKHVSNCVWLLSESEADAIELISEMKLLDEPLMVAQDDKKMDVPKGIVLNADGETFTIVKG